MEEGIYCEFSGKKTEQLFDGMPLSLRTAF